VNFAAITLRVASQRVFTVSVYFVTTQCGNFWIYPRCLQRALIFKIVDVRLCETVLNMQPCVL
jgi:hypothetical protein